MKKLTMLGLCLAFFLFATAASADPGIIRGTIYEQSTGEPLFGVAVRIQNTATGAVSDFDGKFQIKVEPGTYTIEASFVSFKTVTITDLVVAEDDITLIDAIWMEDAVEELEAIVVTGEVIKTNETALLTVKRKSANVMDGISAESFRKIGDGNAGQAAKRVTGVSVEGGKYVYVRGLGDRYTKTTLNGMDIPGLDPDRNSIQIDVFPTNLIDNMVILKSFTPDLPADFTGGIVNIETKDFPEDKIMDVSFGIDFNPAMHFNNDYITYDGSGTDWLGFDNGVRELPANARTTNIPSPINSSETETGEFLNQFSPTLGVKSATSFMNYNFGVSLGNQVQLPNGHTLGYLFSGNYKNSTNLYDDAYFGEYQNDRDIDVREFQRAATATGVLAENNVLLGGLAGLAYKTSLSKFRLTYMRLQNGESRAGDFNLVDDEDAVGKSGYLGLSENLEYNERSISTLFLNGEHHTNDDSWMVDWRVSSTWSSQEDPDIRRTAFTLINDNPRFAAGAAGNPSRLWRSLEEINVGGKVDVVKKHQLFNRDAKLKFGMSHTYKERDYEIVDFNVNFLAGGRLDWTGAASQVWTEETVFPAGFVYLVSGFGDPNPNQYNSNINNTGVYVSSEFSITEELKAIVGVRAENFVQRHTGRDQDAAGSIRGFQQDGFRDMDLIIAAIQANPERYGNVLDNDKVLDNLNFFPSVNLIYNLQDKQNIRFSYGRTIARPSFKELSFAQIIDPVSNRIFNGGLFSIDTWEGNLQETLIDNIDLRWEMFMNRGQLFSASVFYKKFDNAIELVRLPQQQTNAEFQPRNVGNGQLFGLELEFRKSLDFLSDKFSINGNVTLVESRLDFSEAEMLNRTARARTGEEIDDTRSMAGQAPWIVNAGISYNDYERQFDAGFFYNVKGRTLVVVAGGRDPDVFAEPFHSLNFNMNKSFGSDDQWSANFGVSNILGDKLEQLYRRAFSSAEDDNTEIFQRFSPGTSISAGIKYSFR
ncbi:MAG: TonB-dependent receptor [Cytophagales bacterium]|nr:TonB-dependent receptor [Cytophagales bacterium]